MTLAEIVAALRDRRGPYTHREPAATALAQLRLIGVLERGRRALGWSQRQLAERAGLSQQAVRDAERTGAMSRGAAVKALAALGLWPEEGGAACGSSS